MAIDLDRALKALGEQEALCTRARTVLEALRDGEQQTGYLGKEVVDLTRKREALRQALADEEAELAKTLGQAQERQRGELARIDTALAQRHTQLDSVQDNLRLAQERLAALERQAVETAATRRKETEGQITALESAGRSRIAALAQQEADLLKRVQEAERRLARAEEAERALRSRAAAIAKP